jgi:glycosyltransferase involved in cell wall biosynthesis
MNRYYELRHIETLKILLLTANLPYPPASGGAIRTYGIIKGLHQAGQDITLLSFHDGPMPDSPLANYCSRIETVTPPQRTKIDRLRDLLLGKADIAGRFYSLAYHERLLHLITETDFDLIQFEAIEMGCYLPIVRTAGVKAKLCFDTFNAEAELQRNIFNIDRQEVRRWPAAIYSYIQAKRIYRYEGDLCRQADLVIAVSPEDAAILREYRTSPHSHPIAMERDEKEGVFIVPSGIFVDDYQPPTETVNLGPNAIVFTGKMDYRPNVDAMLWFAHDILPLVQQEIPDCHLTIVGQLPHPRLHHLSENPAITLTGWVDSVAPYLYAADVYIAPLRMGSGTRLKILEAMAAGCAPVVTSVAASGLLDAAKSAMMIADTQATLAQAIIHLLQNPERRRKLGEQAKIAVRQHYDWSALIPRLLAAYKEIGLG